MDCIWSSHGCVSFSLYCIPFEESSSYAQLLSFANMFLIFARIMKMINRTIMFPVPCSNLPPESAFKPGFIFKADCYMALVVFWWQEEESCRIVVVSEAVMQSQWTVASDDGFCEWLVLFFDYVQQWHTGCLLTFTHGKMWSRSIPGSNPPPGNKAEPVQVAGKCMSVRSGSGAIKDLQSHHTISDLLLVFLSSFTSPPIPESCT